MDQKSKLPSWLQDKKKALILGIIVICLVLSSANTFGLVNLAVNQTKSALNSDSDKVSADIFKSIFGKGLNGTYENNFYNESLIFSRDGSLVYTYDDEINFGEYKIEDNHLTLIIGGYPYNFEIVKNNGSELCILINGYEYQYTKVK